MAMCLSCYSRQHFGPGTDWEVLYLNTNMLKIYWTESSLLSIDTYELSKCMQLNSMNMYLYSGIPLFTFFSKGVTDWQLFWMHFFSCRGETRQVPGFHCLTKGPFLDQHVLSISQISSTWDTFKKKKWRKTNHVPLDYTFDNICA